MLCDASLFLGEKWTKNRARLGHGHKSTCYKAPSFPQDIMPMASSHHTWVCCLLQNYLPNTPPPRERAPGRGTKGPRRRSWAIHQRPGSGGEQGCVSRKSGREWTKKAREVFSAVLDNSPSRQDLAQPFIWEPKLLQIRAQSGAKLLGMPHLHLPSTFFNLSSQCVPFLVMLSSHARMTGIRMGISMAFRRPPYWGWEALRWGGRDGRGPKRAGKLRMVSSQHCHRPGISRGNESLLPKEASLIAAAKSNMAWGIGHSWPEKVIHKGQKRTTCTAHLEC